MEAITGIPLLQPSRTRASQAFERMIAAHGDEAVAMVGVADRRLLAVMQDEEHQHDLRRRAAVRIGLGGLLIVAGVSILGSILFHPSATVGWVPILSAASIAGGFALGRSGAQRLARTSDPVLPSLVMRLYGVGRLGVYRLDRGEGSTPRLTVLPRRRISISFEDRDDPRLLDILVSTDDGRRILRFDEMDTLEQSGIVMGLLAPQPDDGETMHRFEARICLLDGVAARP